MSTNAIVRHEQSPAGWESKLELVKRNFAKDATPDELEIFFHQCRKTGLDPLAKQIYFQKRKNNKTGQYTMTIITGIDGYRLVADRTGKYAGNDDPIFEEIEGAANPQVARVTVYKIVEGVRCAFTASARWSQYCPEFNDFMWRKMPHLMLGKCAEALALRKAFPAELSGVYTVEEMDQAGQPLAAGQADAIETEAAKPRGIAEVVHAARQPDMQEEDPFLTEQPAAATPTHVRPQPTQAPFAKPATQPSSNGKPVISEAQSKRFFAISRSGTRTQQEINNELGRYGWTHSKQITRDKYEELCAWVAK